MALIVTVVGEPAPLARQRSDELGVLDARLLQLAPEEGAPTALKGVRDPLGVGHNDGEGWGKRGAPDCP